LKIKIEQTNKHMKNYIENPNTIAYLQAAESYSIIVNEGGAKTLKTRPMKHFEDSFLNMGWLRIHRSFLVNPLFVNHISENRDFIFLKNGIKLPISRRKLKYVAAWRMKNL
jgi:two-component system, LytTR family, response regulator